MYKHPQLFLPCGLINTLPLTTMSVLHTHIQVKYVVPYLSVLVDFVITVSNPNFCPIKLSFLPTLLFKPKKEK